MGRHPSRELTRFRDEVAAMEVNDVLKWACETTTLSTLRGEVSKMNTDKFEPVRYKCVTGKGILFVLRIS